MDFTEVQRTNPLVRVVAEELARPEHARSLTVHPGHGRKLWDSAVFQEGWMLLQKKRNQVGLTLMTRGELT